ncbi:MAG: hypothetical protein ABI158_05625 [Edaphobacter sp.]
MAHPVSLGFERVVLHHGDPRTERVGNSSRALLDNVLEFMAKEELSM